MTTRHLPPPENRPAAAREHSQMLFAEHFGKAVFIRIVKEARHLELWCREKNGVWKILKEYEIAGMSGTCGPKTAEGDLQAPEGFYRVYPGSMNPKSKYHLAFNIGYPNAYDKQLNRTGSLIMIHGGSASKGCFAMTDRSIEEIYTMVNEAFEAGSEYVPVQIYPFEMTEERMRKESTSTHYSFWQHLLPGWQHTEATGTPYPDKDNE